MKKRSPKMTRWISYKDNQPIQSPTFQTILMSICVCVFWQANNNAVQHIRTEYVHTFDFAVIMYIFFSAQYHTLYTFGYLFKPNCCSLLFPLPIPRVPSEQHLTCQNLPFPDTFGSLYNINNYWWQWGDANVYVFAYI